MTRTARPQIKKGKLMFNWLKPNKPCESQPIKRASTRTITTERGTRFDVFAETAHFVMCHEPQGSTDTPRQALLDFENLAAQGYWICYIHHMLAGHIVLEKRGHITTDQPQASPSIQTPRDI